MTKNGGVYPKGTGKVLIRGHGFAVDHIALAVSNTENGVAYVEELTGVAPILTKRDPNDFYWSGALEIGEDSFLEIIGPNPDHRGIQPFKSYLAGLKQPRLLFWYIATDNFEAMKTKIEAAGEKVKMVVVVDPDRSANGSDYTRASIGAGFVSQRPGLIEWRKRSVESRPEATCRMTDFRLQHPQPGAFNPFFKSIGVDLAVAEGPSLIGITLETPKGEVVIQNEGTELSLLGMLAAILRRPFG